MRSYRRQQLPAVPHQFKSLLEIFTVRPAEPMTPHRQAIAPKQRTLVAVAVRVFVARELF